MSDWWPTFSLCNTTDDTDSILRETTKLASSDEPFDWRAKLFGVPSDSATNLGLAPQKLQQPPPPPPDAVMASALEFGSMQRTTKPESPLPSLEALAGRTQPSSQHPQHTQPQHQFAPASGKPAAAPPATSAAGGPGAPAAKVTVDDLFSWARQQPPELLPRVPTPGSAPPAPPPMVGGFYDAKPLPPPGWQPQQQQHARQSQQPQQLQGRGGPQRMPMAPPGMLPVPPPQQQQAHQGQPPQHGMAPPGMRMGPPPGMVPPHVQPRLYPVR